MRKSGFRGGHCVAAVVVCCLFLGVPVAAAAHRVGGNPFGCKAKIAGHQWMVTGHGLDCKAATNVVKQLAGKRATGGFFRGTYSGMKCASTSAPGAKPTFIGCADGKRKNIYAVQA
jgi:hypothetical protein